jgi:hypothetical protein
MFGDMLNSFMFFVDRVDRSEPGPAQSIPPSAVLFLDIKFRRDPIFCVSRPQVKGIIVRIYQPAKA